MPLNCPVWLLHRGRMMGDETGIAVGTRKAGSAAAADVKLQRHGLHVEYLYRGPDAATHSRRIRCVLQLRHDTAHPRMRIVTFGFVRGEMLFTQRQ